MHKADVNALWDGSTTTGPHGEWYHHPEDDRLGRVEEGCSRRSALPGSCGSLHSLLLFPPPRNQVPRFCDIPPLRQQGFRSQIQKHRRRPYVPVSCTSSLTMTDLWVSEFGSGEGMGPKELVVADEEEMAAQIQHIERSGDVEIAQLNHD